MLDLRRKDVKYIQTQKEGNSNLTLAWTNISSASSPKPSMAFNTGALASLVETERNPPEATVLTFRFSANWEVAAGTAGGGGGGGAGIIVMEV
jgi:hypothetical protein